MKNDIIRIFLTSFWFVNWIPRFKISYCPEIRTNIVDLKEDEARNINEALTKEKA